MTVIVRHSGLQDYTVTWQQMQQFNLSRNSITEDEIWVLQHPPVFTLGLNGQPDHILDAGAIPLVETDRGGQVTYHGPGQLIIYILFDLKRRKQGVRNIVSRLEQSVIDYLATKNIQSAARKDAPGVYVDYEKIAALGLRVKQGGCYHGLSLNVDMDLAPFEQINPCGYPGLKVTSMRKLGVDDSIQKVAENYLPFLYQQFDIDEIREIHD
ncbi:MAG: lipoyl(octanoyl) transferase LipB [Gammaproteobacteria bacterium]|nr:lipoyl(octanoyl) transferase LipB [Gammaproteobacteria bacterium]